MTGQDKEKGYLCELARAWARGAAGPVAPPPGLDPERLQRLLAIQPALATLASLIDPQALPPQARTQQALATEVARRRTTIMLLELERVLPPLARRGCRPMVLKGASLALTAYPQPEDRWFLDLDLLVERHMLPDVYDVLQQLGYRFSNACHPAHYYEDHHFHRILISSQGICIEVHWAITMPASVYTYDLDALRCGSVEIPLGGASFLAPSALDQILHGVLQSIAGGFGDLRRILDLHLLDARLDDSGRRALCSRAHTSNLATGLWLQYRLRELILEHPIPAAVETSCRPTPGVARLFDRIEVAATCLGDLPLRLDGYDYLLHCLCAPSSRRSREAWRFLFPDRRGLIEAGGPRGQMTPLRRARLHLYRLKTSMRLLGWVAWASVRSRPAC